MTQEPVFELARVNETHSVVEARDDGLNNHLDLFVNRTALRIELVMSRVLTDVRLQGITSNVWESRPEPHQCPLDYNAAADPAVKANLLSGLALYNENLSDAVVNPAAA